MRHVAWWPTKAGVRYSASRITASVLYSSYATVSRVILAFGSLNP